MKIEYNYGQIFELKEIDMYNKELIFKTNDSMGNFDPTNFIEPTVIFEIPFSNVMELQNIPKLLDDYLKENDLLD